MSARNILIVDSNTAARTDLAREVARLGYIVSQAATGEAASLALTRTSRADLVLVDSDLADGDGHALIARLRRRGAMMPAILLADAASEDDVVEGLDAGADDFLIRPLRPRELAARIRAQFRVSLSREESDMQVGVLTYRPASRTAFQPFLPHPVRLTEKEAALLVRLCRAEGRPVSRDTLLREVWGYSPNVSSHTVETHVYRLRRKIEGGANTPRIVLSDEGGYRLATVEAQEDAMAATAPPPWSPAPAPPSLHRPSLHQPLRVLAAAIR
jgi:DNA-binding response OmpR family regulator